ncbi:MAG TPA: hypothetical protein VGR14_09750 [Verrucomicrobiae bacterium]|nr:hypothetical protein [Verrucomicrobiae bacterium]
MGDPPDGGTGSQSGGGTGGSNAGSGNSNAGSGSSAAGSGSSTAGSGSSTTGSAGSSGSGSGSGCTFCNSDNQAAVARGGQSTNGSGSPSQSPCLGQTTPQHGVCPSTRGLTTTEKIFLQAVMAGMQVLPGGSIVTLLGIAGTIANANGCTVALGFGGDAIGIGGVSGGVGIYYGPSGEIGLYGAVGLDAGFAMGLSAEIVYTIIAGAPSVNFAGDCWVVTLSGGELAVAGGSAIFAYSDGHFVGVSLSAGIGAGAPIGLYGQLSHTWITPPN